jgi:outer membrane biosynthesis protein TonB
MFRSIQTLAVLALATAATAQSGWQPPRLVAASIGSTPWNVASAGGIAACEVSLDANGQVAGVTLVQDVQPYGAQLREAVQSWSFEAAREGDRSVPARVLVLGLFRPPTLSISAPETLRYKTTNAPPELPWPTFVAIPPYPANVVGSGAVILQSEVAEDGSVGATRVLNAGSPFDAAAHDAAAHWTYRPATRNGRNVASRVFLLFTFTGVTP